MRACFFGYFPTTEWVGGQVGEEYRSVIVGRRTVCTFSFLSPKSFLLLSLLHAQQLKFESALRSLLFFFFTSFLSIVKW